jgi:hypothetical protein
VDQNMQTSLNTDEMATAVLEPKHFKYVPAGAGPAHWGPGDQIRFLITGEETGGAFFMAEVSVPPGGGARPHVHNREEESFHLLQGTLTVHVGGTAVPSACRSFCFEKITSGEIRVKTEPADSIPFLFPPNTRRAFPVCNSHLASAPGLSGAVG